jgi:hypothetical protein
MDTPPTHLTHPPPPSPLSPCTHETHPSTASPSSSSAPTAPSLSRNISVACIYPQLQRQHGFIPLQETLYEVVEADFVAIGATQSTSLLSSSSSLSSTSHPFLQVETFTIHKYPEEAAAAASTGTGEGRGAPSMLEQTINQSRLQFNIPPSRPIKILPAMDFSLDYLFQDEWSTEFRNRIQMIAVVDQTSSCLISILGLTKLDHCYHPITQYNEISGSLELTVVIDWNLMTSDGRSSVGEISCSETKTPLLLLDLLMGYLKLNQSKYLLTMKSSSSTHSPTTMISCELSILLLVEVMGTNEQQSLSIPFSSFTSINEFLIIIRQKFNLKPQCCVQIRVPTRLSDTDADIVPGIGSSDSSRIFSSRVLWDIQEVFHYCLKCELTDIPLLYLKFCEVPEEGIACETISGSSCEHGTSSTSENLICHLSGCGHYVCQLCLLRHLVLYSNDRKSFSSLLTSSSSALTALPLLLSSLLSR